MRATERMTLLETIGTELQRRYTFSDLDGFFAALGIQTTDFEHGSSKRLYAKEVLRHAADSRLLDVATELGLGRSTGASIEPPANWRGVKQFRLLVSHISANKVIATRLKQALATHSILGFVAHEDIHPTLAWQDEIERALQTMDAFVAVHTPGFKDSIWTQQEIGFALGRGTKIISFKMGEDPTGFIGKHQALARQGRTAEAIAGEIGTILLADDRTAEKRRRHRRWPASMSPFKSESPSGSAPDGSTRVEIVTRQAMTSARYLEAVRLCERAYDDDDDVAALMREFAGATHVLLLNARGILVSHAMWIERWLTHRHTRVRTAYVELVATDPDCRQRGHASKVMRALGNAITGFDVGALSPSDPAYYARFGWETWRGPLFEQRLNGELFPSSADEAVMILRRPDGPELDLDGALTAPWRPGDVW